MTNEHTSCYSCKQEANIAQLKWKERPRLTLSDLLPVMHVQNEELPKELKHVCFKNYQKAGKIYKKSEAETAIDHVQETKARPDSRKSNVKRCT